jgi:hypothetical protein
MSIAAFGRKTCLSFLGSSASVNTVQGKSGNVFLRAGQQIRLSRGEGRSGNEDGPIHDLPDFHFAGKILKQCFISALLITSRWHSSKRDKNSKTMEAKKRVQKTKYRIPIERYEERYQRWQPTTILLR